MGGWGRGTVLSWISHERLVLATQVCGNEDTIEISKRSLKCLTKLEMYFQLKYVPTFDTNLPLVNAHV